jgi:hypothetical protein
VAVAVMGITLAALEEQAAAVLAVDEALELPEQRILAEVAAAGLMAALAVPVSSFCLFPQPATLAPQLARLRSPPQVPTPLSSSRHQVRIPPKGGSFVALCKGL